MQRFKLLVALVVMVVASGTGCTMVNTVTLPSTPGESDVFVTSGDIQQPHDVVGLIQASRSGVMLFGFWDVIGTDLNAGFRKTLLPKVRELGGDGVVRVRYNMTQYTPMTRVLGAILFIFPLPTSVTITGQVVKLKKQ